MNIRGLTVVIQQNIVVHGSRELLFLVKNIAKKNENFMMSMRKFPQPTLIIFQDEK